MATKPADKPLWTFSNPDLALVSIEPDGSKKITGWQANEKPPYQTMNWLFYNLSLWVDFVEDPQITPTSIDDSDSPYDADTLARIILVDSLGGAVTVNLPAAADAKGVTFTIIKISNDTNNVTVDPDGAETVSGLATVAFKRQFSIAKFVSNGVDGWFFELFEERLSQVQSNDDGDSPVTIASSQSGTRFFFDSSAGAMTYNLPAPVDGLLFHFKDVGGASSSNPVTIARNASESIEGLAANYLLESDNGSWSLQAVGGNWYVV